MRPAFLITIDTEGDNVWARRTPLTTENARFLPRFQLLAERYGFPPTYLVNYEMAQAPEFVAFAAGALKRGAAEIGAHLHAWNTPPIAPLTDDDERSHPFATEFPATLHAEKLAVLTRLLESTFQTRIVSHRAGRWAFNETSARLLVEAGYRVDCSVTPGVDWSANPGATGGGPDYSDAPSCPYWIGSLLEVPVTIGATRPGWVERFLPHRLFPRLTWLRPDGRNLRGMLRLLDAASAQQAPCAEFMLHSSELMPGGSPNFPDAASIERLYRHLDELFAAAARSFAGSTLSAFTEIFK